MASSTVAGSRRPNVPLDREEALAIRAAEMAQWARRNVRAIVGIALAVLLVLGGFVYYRVSAAQRSAAAAERLLALQQNPAVETGAGTRELEAFLQQYAGTSEADQARLMLAEARLRGGQPREAAAAVEALAGSRSPLAAAAGMLLGAAHVEAGDPAAAVRAFERAAERSEHHYQRLEALGQAAMVQEEAGNYAGAAAIYERILADAEDGSMQQSVVQMRLTEAQARAGAPN